MKTILVVDDEKDLREMFCDALCLDFKVLEAGNGLEALNTFKTEKVDIIVSDIRMPEMDGLTLLKEVRKLEPKIPFITMTGQVEFDLKEVIKMGATGVLAKPFSLKNLCLMAKEFTT